MHALVALLELVPAHLTKSTRSKRVYAQSSLSSPGWFSRAAWAAGPSCTAFICAVASLIKSSVISVSGANASRPSSPPRRAAGVAVSSAVLALHSPQWPRAISPRSCVRDHLVTPANCKGGVRGCRRPPPPRMQAHWDRKSHQLEVARLRPDARASSCIPAERAGLAPRMAADSRL